ncbi:MAG: Nif11-like leader peptide family RiPP precursor [Peptostreptococcaceae bacterium]|nr:Nif11-like leader peptide family RiPP precursor [Peptostreptococcaceae bacterium]
MNEEIEKLFKKMNEDKSFAEKIMSQTDNEKLIEIAKGEGIELSVNDIDEANEIIRKALKAKNEGELSEEELENVAGGTITIAAVAIGTVGLVTSAVSAGAAVGSAFSLLISSAYATYVTGE